jgi:hypothetical protein
MFSRVAIRLVRAEIDQATRRVAMPDLMEIVESTYGSSQPRNPWAPTYSQLAAAAAWAGLTCLAATGTAVLVVVRIMRGVV